MSPVGLMLSGVVKKNDKDYRNNGNIKSAVVLCGRLWHISQQTLSLIRQVNSFM